MGSERAEGSRQQHGQRDGLGELVPDQGSRNNLRREAEVHPCGSIVGASFTPGDDNTAFLDYLTGIESTKHMFTQLLAGTNQHQHGLFSINQEPDLVVTKRSSASTRTSHFSANGQRGQKHETNDHEDDASDDDGDGDKEEPPPKSKRRNTSRDPNKTVHYTHGPPPPTGPPPRMPGPQLQNGALPPPWPTAPQITPVHERCRNDSRGQCVNPHCTNVHANFNRMSSELCNAHITPGM